MLTANVKPLLSTRRGWACVSPALKTKPGNLVERIDADLREILADHRPDPLSESIRSEIASIERCFAESLREKSI